jgi:hypothetical protein
MIHGMMYTIKNMMEFIRSIFFSTTKCHTKYRKKNLQFIQNQKHHVQLMNHNTNNEINDSHHIIPIGNIINNKQYDL